MRPRALALRLALLLVAGCGPVPFPEVALVPLGDVRPEDVLAEVRAALPQRFTVLNAVVFKKYGKSISVLGYTSVDEPGDSITVAVLTPAGIKLCDASDVGGHEEVRYVAAALAERGDVAGVVLRDIRRIYFDRLPATGAAWRRESDRLVFSQEAGRDRVEYVLAGAPVLPIRKESYEGRRRSWAISYDDPEWHGERVFPKGIILRNEKQGYELIVRLLEVVSVDGTGN